MEFDYYVTLGNKQKLENLIHLLRRHRRETLPFDNEEGKIIHVGILIGDNKIIHASGCVRIDPFDHFGIFSQERGGYTHNLRVIKNTKAFTDDL